MLIRSRQQLVCRKLKIFIQQDFAVLHIVDLCTHLIHTVRRIYGHHIIYARFTKSTKNKIYGLIAAITQKDMFGTYLLYSGQFMFQLPLHRIRIAVVRHVIRIFIRIKKNTREYDVEIDLRTRRFDDTTFRISLSSAQNIKSVMRALCDILPISVSCEGCRYVVDALPQ